MAAEHVPAMILKKELGAWVIEAFRRKVPRSGILHTERRAVSHVVHLAA